MITIKSTLRLKFLYALLFAAACSAAPYMTIFLSRVLLIPTEEIGILFSVVPFAESLSATFWTAYADKNNAHRKTLLFCLMNAMMSMMIIPIFGSILKFEFVVLVFVVLSLFNGSIIPLVDNFTLGTLKMSGIKSEYEYGKQRLWGTISCGIISSIMGILTDYISIFIIFVGYIFFMMGSLLFIYRINPSDFNTNFDNTVSLEELNINNEENLESLENFNDVQELEIDDNRLLIDHQPSNFRIILTLLVGNPQFLYFLFIILLIAIVKAVAAAYLLLFLSEFFNASGTLLGLSQIMSVSLEVVFFYFSKNIMESIGPRNMIILGQVALLIRVGLYGFLGKILNPWMALPIELLQGVLYALIWPAGLKITRSISPKIYQATSIGIYSGVFGGLATGIGSITERIIFRGKHVHPYTSLSVDQRMTDNRLNEGNEDINL
ncbi:10405_t:CDS:2 [Diversispora eburnea]|uniref:10405_t:CDS:1 n=1 Tax=Diversispora eburnea TaxID=1213867 RepID=A0A9N8UXS2_9GLOM|nr:10405_t:CDS:2 [Diversispora eburnea]